jgi:uncharacterized membrane protein YfcA
LNHALLLVALGIAVGIYSGIMGLGGGTLMIPAMVLLLGFTQKQALGTSLAVMLPPVTFPAVLEYWRSGHVKIGTAALIALGVVPGMFLGAYLANKLSNDVLKLIFGFVLIYVAGYTIFGKEHLVRSMLLSGVIVLVAGGVFLLVRWYDAVRAAAAT